MNGPALASTAKSATITDISPVGAMKLKCTSCGGVVEEDEVDQQQVVPCPDPQIVYPTSPVSLRTAIIPCARIAFVATRSVFSSYEKSRAPTLLCTVS